MDEARKIHSEVIQKERCPMFSVDVSFASFGVSFGMLIEDTEKQKRDHRRREFSRKG